MAFLGYENHNSIKVLGSVSIFLIYWIIKLLLLPVIYIITGKSQRAKLWYQKFKRALIWGGLFTTILAAYIEILIACNLNLQFPLFTLNGEIASFIFALFCSISCFAVILGFCYLSCLTLSQLKQEETRQKWGALYSDVKLKTRFQFLFWFLYCIRRIQFVYLVLYL